MSIDILFIHSAGSQSEGQGSSPFVKHLRDGLGADYNIINPEMPAPSQPSYFRWKESLDKLFSNKHAPQILIGHSLGGSVLLKYLTENISEIQILGLFIVAAPYWGREDWELEEFVLRDDFSEYLPKTLNIYLYQSLDDEVLSAEHLSSYSREIPDAIVRKLGGGGHTFKNGLAELVCDIQILTT